MFVASAQGLPDTYSMAGICSSSALVRILLAFLSLLLRCPDTCSALQNITIDDEQGVDEMGGKLVYLPDGGWTQGGTCSGCKAQPDHSQAFDGTWHDATHHPGDAADRTIELQFEGSAVYVFFIVANTIPFVTTFTNLTFNLDGAHVGDFMHTPTDDTNFLYNVPVYSNSDISLGQHQLNVVATGTNASLLLFDYAVYTVDDKIVTPAPPMGSLSITVSASVNTPSFTSNSGSATSASATTVSATITTTTAQSISSIAQETASQETASQTVVGSQTTSDSIIQTDSAQHSSANNALIIVGPAVGGTVLVLLVVLALWFCRKRRNRMAVNTTANPIQFEPAVGETRGASLARPTHSSLQSKSGERDSHTLFENITNSFGPPAIDLAHSQYTAASPNGTNVALSGSGSEDISRQHVQQHSSYRQTLVEKTVNQSSQQQTLEKRIEDVKNTIDALTSHASIQTSEGTHDQEHTPSTTTGYLNTTEYRNRSGQDSSPVQAEARREGDTEPLRQRIVELQVEMEEMRSQLELFQALNLGHDAPPGYDEDS